MSQTALHIARRIVFNPQPSFSRFIIRLAAAATALSVAAMVVALSMINGFQHEVSRKVYSFWGHLRIHEMQPLRSSVAEELLINLSAPTSRLVQQWPGVAHVQAYATKSVVLKTSNQFEGILLKGVDEGLLRSGFSSFLAEGRLPAYPDSGYAAELVVSQKVARQLGVGLGARLQVFYIRQGEDLRSRPATIVGLFHTGIDEYDRQFALTDLRFLQRLSQWEPTQAAGYEVWLKDAGQADAVSRGLYRQLPQGLAATPIVALYPNIFDWLAIQNQTRNVVIGVMLAVAVVNLLTCLLILVMERTRMVAVLSALGMRPRHIRQVFWYYAGIIAAAGVGIGLLLGLGLLALQQATGFIKLDESTYYVSTMPVQIVGWQVVAVAVGAFAVCLLALRLPLYYTGRVPIVKALRFS